MKRSFNHDRTILDIGGYDDPRDFISLNDCFQNVYITGSTGTGKTSSSGAALANTLLNADGLEEHEKVGMVIYLYKASDAKDWEQWAWEQGRENDLIRIGAEHKDVLNILSLYENDEPANAVNCLMNVSGLASGGSRKESESFWETEQKKRLDRLVRLNQISGESLNIQTLYQLHISAPNDPEQANSDEFAESSLLANFMGKAAQKVGEDHSDFVMVRDYFYNEMLYLDERPASSIKSMTSGILEPFISSKILSNLFCGDTLLSIDEVFSGKIVLLDIPVQRHEYIGKLAQSLIGYCLMKAVEKRDLEKHGNPFIFWMDECQNFLIPYTSLFMSVSRSSRAGHVLMTQNISNIKSVLGNSKGGESIVDSLLGLCNTKIMHANNDSVTNEWAARTIGKAFINVSSVSVDRESTASASSSQQLHYLVEPRKFNVLRTGGAKYDYLVDAYITGTGRTFSNEFNFIRATFKQHFARG